MKQISLTTPYKNRLGVLKTNGINSKKFNPDSIDLTKTFNSFQEDKKKIFDEKKGFTRIIKNPAIKKQLENWLIKKLNENISLNVRFLVGLPVNFSDYDGLRDTFLEIQENAGMKKLYVFFGISEDEKSINNYVKKLNKEKKYILVFDMAMEFEVLKPILEKYIEAYSEIDFLYRNWDENKENFNFVIRTAQKNPEKLHMAFVPVDLNDYGDSDVFSTILICNGFKSVSLVDTEFKRFFSKWRNPNKIKTHNEKVQETKWINEKVMDYEKKHNSSCICFGKGNTSNSIMKNTGIKEAVTHHNLEVLSDAYSNPKRQDLLNLDTMKSILVSLKLQ